MASINKNLPISLDKRLIDLTCGELVTIVNILLEAAAEKLKPEPVTTEKPDIHPETGLPEGPEEEVGGQRACEILRSVYLPLGNATLTKYRKKYQEDVTGANIGGFNLPYRKIGGLCMYKVNDLLAIKNDLYYFC